MTIKAIFFSPILGWKAPIVLIAACNITRYRSIVPSSCSDCVCDLGLCDLHRLMHSKSKSYIRFRISCSEIGIQPEKKHTECMLMRRVRSDVMRHWHWQCKPCVKALPMGTNSRTGALAAVRYNSRCLIWLGYLLRKYADPIKSQRKTNFVNQTFAMRRNLLSFCEQMHSLLLFKSNSIWV